VRIVAEIHQSDDKLDESETGEQRSGERIRGICREGSDQNAKADYDRHDGHVAKIGQASRISFVHTPDCTALVSEAGANPARLTSRSRGFASADRITAWMYFRFSPGQIRMIATRSLQWELSASISVEIGADRSPSGPGAKCDAALWAAAGR
jgi:hypothetical protein